MGRTCVTFQVIHNAFNIDDLFLCNLLIINDNSVVAKSEKMNSLSNDVKPRRSENTNNISGNIIRGRNIFHTINLLAIIILISCALHQVQAKPDIFTNAFLVKMRQPVIRQLADDIAKRNGFVNLGSVSFNFSIIFIINYVFVLCYLSIVVRLLKTYCQFNKC